MTHANTMAMGWRTGGHGLGLETWGPSRRFISAEWFSCKLEETEVKLAETNRALFFLF